MNRKLTENPSISHAIEQNDRIAIIRILADSAEAAPYHSSIPHAAWFQHRPAGRTINYWLAGSLIENGKRFVDPLHVLGRSGGAGCVGGSVFDFVTYLGADTEEWRSHRREIQRGLNGSSRCFRRGTPRARRRRGERNRSHAVLGAACLEWLVGHFDKNR